MNRKIEILKSGSWIATIVKLIIFRIIILVIDICIRYRVYAGARSISPCHYFD